MTIWLASGNKHKQQELAAILAGNAVTLPAEAGITDFDPAETGSCFAENALIKARALHALLAGGPEKPQAGLAAGTDLTGSTELTAGPVLADDSGLCVDVLGGRPGIYSARYYGKNSWAGNGSFREKPGAAKKCTDKERNILLLEELENLIPHTETRRHKVPGAFSKRRASLCASASLCAGKRQSTLDMSGSRRCRFVCAMVLLFSPDRFYLVQETLEGEIVSSAGEIRGAGGFGYDPIVYLPELGRTVAELSEEEKNRLSHRGKAGRAIARLL